MPVWKIDGEVTAVELRNRKGKHVVLRRLQIRGHDGTEHDLKTICAAGEVAEALTPGTRGRFYISKSLDTTGVHAMRLENGQTAHVWPHNIELMSFIMLGAGAILLVAALLGYRGLGLIGLVGLPLGAIFYTFVRKARREGQKQYEEDTSPIVVMSLRFI